MKQLFALRPSPAMVIACIALGVALGGRALPQSRPCQRTGRHEAAQEERGHLVQGQERLAPARRLQVRADPRRAAGSSRSGGSNWSRRRSRYTRPTGPRPVQFIWTTT